MRGLAVVLLCSACASGEVATDAATRVDAAAPSDAATLADAAPTLLDATLESDAGATPRDGASEDAGGHTHGRVGGHGMLLFGAGDAYYLSHIPAFFEPHTAQVIVEVRIVSPAPMTFDASGTLHSFSPAGPFSLDALRAGAITELRGALFRGNYEQGAQMIEADARLELERVVYQAELGTAVPPRQTYVVFGGYAAHVIGAAPSYDQIARARTAVPLRGAMVLSRDVGLDDPSTRLTGQGTFTSTAGLSIELTLDAELSCLVGPGFGPPCP